MAIKDKTAKIMALRTATVVLYNSMELDWEEVPLENVEKINKHIEKLAEAMYKRAVKAGGEFSRYSGY